jgi:transposase-like protein
MLNAANEVFPDATVLRCYFHVMQNVKKHQNLVPAHLYESLLSDIRVLHYSKNETEFKHLFHEFRSGTRKPLKLFTSISERNRSNETRITSTATRDFGAGESLTSLLVLQARIRRSSVSTRQSREIFRCGDDSVF